MQLSDMHLSGVHCSTLLRDEDIHCVTRKSPFIIAITLSTVNQFSYFFGRLVLQEIHKKL